MADSSNPFADLIPADKAPKVDASNPFADLVPGPAAPPPADTLREPSAAESFARGVAGTVVAPAANFLVADPIRGLAADVVGAVKSPPFGEKGREGFWQAREKSLEQSSSLRVPESEAGQAVTAGAGAIGGGLVNALGGASNFVLGEGPTKAIAPFAQMFGDALPAIGARMGAARGAAPRPPGMAPNPQAAAARSAGYTLPPEEISATPSTTARLLSGESGKWKKQQAFSVDNQANTNRLAAQSIGLPPETRLTEPALERARQPAIRSYEAIRTAVPDTALAADPAFQQAVSQVGVRSAEVEAHFPEMSRNPAILELRENLLQNAASPTRTVMEKIADLRREAASNFRVRDNAQAHALGYAQRQAATALEDAIERSIGYGTARVEAFAERHRAAQEVQRQEALNRERGYGPGNLAEATQNFRGADRNLTAAQATITPAEVANAQALRQQYQQGRQLFARIYDIESSLNPGTRDVVASRVAGLRRVRGRGLNGEMANIADAAEAFPREMQDPAKFGGHAEDFSVLDIIGGAGMVASGHPVAAGVIAGRYPARRVLGSDWYQNRMFNRQPLVSTPGSGAVAGELAMPREDDPISRALNY